MRGRSKKMARVYRQTRIPLVQALLADPVVCVWPGCSQVATDPDEIVPRGRGGSITDPSNVQGLCHFHNAHKQLPGFRGIAEAAGLLAGSGSLRHPWVPDEVGFYCRVCNLPALNWRHRADAA
jgi:hypothetical protein